MPDAPASECRARPLAQCIGIVVDFHHFFHRVRAAQITEGGVLRHGEGIFGVEHNHVHAQRRQLVNVTLHGLDLHDGVARHVDHGAAGREVALLLPGTFLDIFLHSAGQQKETARQRIDVIGFDTRTVCTERNGQNIRSSSLYLHRERQHNTRCPFNA